MAESKILSNSEDRIPLMISERLIDVTRDYTGEYIMVNGQFRSYNRHEEQKVSDFSPKWSFPIDRKFTDIAVQENAFRLRSIQFFINKLQLSYKYR